MRTLFILNAITVAALGHMPNSCPKITKENLTNSLQTLQNIFENETTTVLQLQSYIMALQNIRVGQDQNIIHEQLSNSPKLLQSMYDNISARVYRLYLYFMNLQNDRDYQDPKITECLSSSLRILQSFYNNVTEIILQLNSNLMTLQKDLTSYERKPTSCADVRKYDAKSGIHTLFLDDNKILDVYCDQDTDGGGWMVIQRRQDGSVDFYRNWTEYERGFGNLSTEFWIGLANLHHLTKYKTYKLRVDLTDFDGSKVYAIYNTFNISGADDKYRLDVGRYSGTAGDSLAFHNRMLFTTYDRDYDFWDGNCAQLWHGAWWYENCHKSNLNGRYRPDTNMGDGGLTWYFYKSDWRSYKRVEMKIKQ